MWCKRSVRVVIMLSCMVAFFAVHVTSDVTPRNSTSRDIVGDLNKTKQNQLKHNDTQQPNRNITTKQDQNDTHQPNASASHWGYEGPAGPEHWKDNYPTCASKSQSPINLEARGKPNIADPIHFSQYSTGPASNVTFELKNSGHGVVAAVTQGSKPIKISGGGLPGNYTLAQFHAHWGKNDKEGSEHALQGSFYPMELHFVHYNSDLFASFQEAASSGKDGALAVVGVFVKVSKNANPILGVITDQLSKIKYVGNTTQLGVIDVSKALPDVTNSFFRYSGSLTTPPCTEGVIWTVLKDSYITITSDQLNKFRTQVLDSELKPININYRPLQGLNGRVVSTK